VGSFALSPPSQAPHRVGTREGWKKSAQNALMNTSAVQERKKRDIGFTCLGVTTCCVSEGDTNCPLAMLSYLQMTSKMILMDVHNTLLLTAKTV